MVSVLKKQSSFFFFLPLLSKNEEALRQHSRMAGCNGKLRVEID
jgi:hypothetical protein